MSKSSSGMGMRWPGSRSLGSLYPADRGGSEWERVRARASTDRAQDGTGAVPAPGRPPGRPAERFAGRLRGRHPAAVFFAGAAGGLRAPRRDLDRARPARHRRAAAATAALPRTDESVVESIVAERTPFLTDVSEVGSTIGGAPLLPILVGLIATRMRVPAQVADRGVRRLRAGRRVGDLPRDLARRAARAAPRPAARGPARRRQLPVRSHRGGDRGLRRPGPAAHVALPAARPAHRCLGAGDPAPVVRRAPRACTAACTIRSTSPAGLVIGIGALLVLLFACRAAGVAHAARSPRAPAAPRRAPPQPVA